MARGLRLLECPLIGAFTLLPPQGALATEEAVIASRIDIGLESRKFVAFCRASLSVVSLFRKHSVFCPGRQSLA